MGFRDLRESERLLSLLTSGVVVEVYLLSFARYIQNSIQTPINYKMQAYLRDTAGSGSDPRNKVSCYLSAGGGSSL